MSYDTKPLIPGHPDGQARILVIGRLSKAKETEEQTQETLDSSLAVAREHLKSIYNGPMILIRLAEQASGLIADRATILEAEELIATGDIDLVITEDLSRIFRSPRLQHAFVDNCVDAGVRVICVADKIDTADEDWESAMGVASFRHSMPISDCRRRQKRKSIFAFHGGGNVQKIKYGYVKLTREQTASGDYGPDGLRMAKDPDATVVIKKMRELLMTEVDGQYGYAPVMKYLNENKVPTGSFVTGDTWRQPVVKGILTDPILMGLRRFRTVLFTRIRRTGKFRRETNPDGPETEHYPELAHLTDDEFISMQQVIEEIAAKNPNRNQPGQPHPLYRKPMKNAIFPRQHATCSVCNGRMYAYDTDQVKCENAHERGEDHCWNHVQVNQNLAQDKVVGWLIEQFDLVDGLRDVLIDFASEELKALRAQHNKGRSGRQKTITQLEREAVIIAKAIRVGGDFDSLIKEAQDIEDQLGKLRELEKHSVAGENSLPACCSPEEVDQQLDEVLLHLAATSYEFANLMRSIITQFEIVPVQAIDSGLVRPRARITLSIDQLRGKSDDGPVVPDVQVELDLFDLPMHFRYREECLAIKRENPKWSYIKIAEAINERIARQRKEGDDPKTISYMTVKRCFGINRQMESEGLSEPYRVLTEKPEYASRWRHRR